MEKKLIWDVFSSDEKHQKNNGFIDGINFR